MFTPHLRLADIEKALHRYDFVYGEVGNKRGFMEFTYHDRQTLYDAWMSYKAKLRITQIEMAKRLGVSQLDFSKTMRGDVPMDRNFVFRFCKEMGLDPGSSLPSLKDNKNIMNNGAIVVRTSLTVDGTIAKVEYSGDQVFIEYVKEI
ncbi:hypothetical protein D515_04062 [Grimontia indica]|uniref:Uncharacterized protein n=2 Tax=Vibrionaceae TaxID=641 RepID=R1IKA6_9GAMM|nr:hypothetical protein D515_04062 [Grimontia indica]